MTQKPRIIIAYESPYQLTIFLEDKGYDVFPFENGFRATQFAVDEKRQGRVIDLLITGLEDRSMYCGTLFSFMRKIYPAMPIVVINNSSDPLRQQCAKNNRVNEIFDEAFDFDELGTCVQRLLAQQSQAPQ